MGKSFLLTRLVFVAYGQLAWSFFSRLRFGLVFFAYGPPPGRKLGLVFFAYGFPCLEIGFGLFCLRFPHRK